MTTATTSIHALITAALTAGGVSWVYGPADEIATDANGLVAQTAVLWPSARLNQYARTSGTHSGGRDRATVVCVGATVRDALAVADKVDAAIGGRMLSSKGGTLMQTAATDPAPEPNADPIRVSLAVEYTTITKGVALVTPDES